MAFSVKRRGSSATQGRKGSIIAPASTTGNLNAPCNTICTLLVLQVTCNN